HRPGEHALVVNGRPCTRIVLGDWYEQGSVLVVHADGSHERRVLNAAAAPAPRSETGTAHPGCAPARPPLPPHLPAASAGRLRHCRRAAPHAPVPGTSPHAAAPTRPAPHKNRPAAHAAAATPPRSARRSAPRSAPRTAAGRDCA